MNTLILDGNLVAQNIYEKFIVTTFLIFAHKVEKGDPEQELCGFVPLIPLFIP